MKRLEDRELAQVDGGLTVCYPVRAYRNEQGRIVVEFECIYIPFIL